jgi:hypothetical protein
MMARLKVLSNVKKSQEIFFGNLISGKNEKGGSMAALHF